MIWCLPSAKSTRSRIALKTRRLIRARTGCSVYLTQLKSASGDFANSFSRPDARLNHPSMLCFIETVPPNKLIQTLCNGSSVSPADRHILAKIVMQQSPQCPGIGRIACATGRLRWIIQRLERISARSQHVTIIKHQRTFREIVETRPRDKLDTSNGQRNCPGRARQPFPAVRPLAEQRPNVFSVRLRLNGDGSRRSFNYWSIAQLFVPYIVLFHNLKNIEK